MRRTLPRSGGFLFACLLSTVSSSAATRYVWQQSPNPGPPFTNWATAAHIIQEALDAAVAGDVVMVTNGVYDAGGRAVSGLLLSNRVAVEKPITLQSVNGPEVTVIRGHQLPGTTNGDLAVRCAYLTNGAIMVGFALTNGATRSGGEFPREVVGGGIWCDSTNVVVANCVLAGNCSASHGGGAAYGTLNQCILIGNVAPLLGGGAYEANLNHCVLASNRAGFGGGFASFRGEAVLNNCLLVSNWAGFGGGAYYGRLSNCTLVGNYAITNGGGVFRVTMNNSIAYYNYAELAPWLRNHYETVLNYCCTIPVPDGSVGNLASEPAFVSLAAGDLRLQSNSPCINAGLNAHAPGLTDLDGNPRIVNGTVDMGAHEWQVPSFFEPLSPPRPRRTGAEALRRGWASLWPLCQHQSPGLDLARRVDEHDRSGHVHRSAFPRVTRPVLPRQAVALTSWRPHSFRPCLAVSTLNGPCRPCILAAHENANSYWPLLAGFWPWTPLLESIRNWTNAICLSKAMRDQ